MNCRTFHKNLEDYLQGGLDFPGRFGMERHAMQCIGCGKFIADAQELRRKLSELKRVKAPADFESSLLDKIGTRKTRGRFSAFRRFWIYSLEWPLLKKSAFAASTLAFLMIGIAFSFHLVSHMRPPAPLPLISATPVESFGEVNPPPVVKGPMDLPLFQSDKRDVSAVRLFKAMQPQHRLLPMQKTLEILDVPAPTALTSVAQGTSLDDEIRYLRITITWPGDRPVPPVHLLPKELWIPYLPVSEDYFIQNVSH
jgi:hypothetical protein